MKFRFFFWATLAIFSVGAPLSASDGNELYRGRGLAIVVEIETHSMRLCEQDRVVQAYRVALGRDGADKRKQGDGKTTLGTYPLGTPSASSRFGIFIPVGYPTPEQREKGYTGSAIGVHGPDRRFKWLGRMTSWIDWAEGCIAVGRDEDIESVAQWVKDKRVTRISIELSR